MLAPNGNKSNLTPEQYRLVRTPEFISWFGDWINSPETASKVVDENGEPLVLFNGSISNFTVFDRKKIGYLNYKRTNIPKTGGFFFTNKYNVAKSYVYRADQTISDKVKRIVHGKVRSFFLNIRNIYSVSMGNKWDCLYVNSETKECFSTDDVSRSVYTLMDNDGVVFKNVIDTGNTEISEEESDIYVAFESNQIKLADGSNTTFDGSNPDIRFDNGGQFGGGKFTLPENHKPFLKVPKGGSSCANCKFLSEDKLHCVQKDFVEWYGTSKLPQPIDEFCSDWYEPSEEYLAKGGELRFYSDCVGYPVLSDLEHIIDKEKEIKYNTFVANVNKEDRLMLERRLGYGSNFPITKDWHVRYFRSKDEDGNTVYFMRHSAIEYVFSPKGGSMSCGMDDDYKYGGQITSIKANDFVVLKYIDDDKQLGFLEYYFDTNGNISIGLDKEPFNFNNEMYISIVEVEEEHRGKGIAKKLIKKAIENAKEMGIKVVTLRRDAGMGCNYGSDYDNYLKKIYSSLGFVETWTEKDVEQIGGEKNICGMHLVVNETTFKEGGQIPSLKNISDKDKKYIDYLLEYVYYNNPDEEDEYLPNEAPDWVINGSREYLKNKGITKIYRGVQKGSYQDDDAFSWTYDKEVANFFAKEDGKILEKPLPKDIISIEFIFDWVKSQKNYKFLSSGLADYVNEFEGGESEVILPINKYNNGGQFPMIIKYARIKPIREGGEERIVRVSPDEVGGFVAGYVIYYPAKSNNKVAYFTKPEFKNLLDEGSYILYDTLEQAQNMPMEIDIEDQLKIRQRMRSLLKLLKYKATDESGMTKEDRFIERVIALIYDGKDFKSKLDIENIAEKEFDFQDKRKVRELTEYAVLFVGREISKTYGNDIRVAYKKMVSLYSNQPYSTHRTSTSVNLGQFSTPAPMAYLMGCYVGINKPNGKLFFESCAGNGMLTVAGRPQDFVVNELDMNRYNNLLKEPYKLILNQDANKKFNFDYKFDGLLANPPFATTKNDVIVGGFHISGLEQQIIVHSLSYLKNEAKIAFIIGGHTEFDEAGRIRSKKDRAFLSYLFKHYYMDDVINVSGSLYGRQGTTYPIRIILIAAKKSEPNGFYPLENKNLNKFEPFSTKVIENFDELFKRTQKYIEKSL